MSREQLEAHLQLFAELGVEGFRREPEWRTRVLPDDILVGRGLLAPPDETPVGRVLLGHRSAEREGGLDPPKEVLSDPPEASVKIFANAADALAAVRVDLGPDCQRCKLHTLGRRQVVFGVGNPDADLMFVGEAPGADEDLKGEPFVGRAGQLLTRIIEAIGLSRADVYIANVIKCRPPGNRNPEPDEVEQCEPFLFRQIDAIRPKVIVALGKFAAQCLLKTDAPITRIRGREFSYRDAILIPTYHPAYLLRNPSAKRDVWEDMKRVRAILTQGADE